MINIAELLKDVAKHTELYSPICGHCKLSGILYDDGIRVIAHDVPFRFDKYGRFCSADNAECLLFPSKDCRTWEGWKLPSKPNFKVGDWVANGQRTVQVSSIGYEKINGATYMMYYHNNNIIGGGVESVDKEFHLWTIKDAKDGDILTDGKLIVIFNKLEEPAYKQHIIAYIGLDLCGRLQITEDTWQLGVDKAMPATKEQRDILFAKMREAGYEWDKKKKELKNIPKHYDISNFHAGMPVLVRDSDELKWLYTIFGIYNKDNSLYPFVVVNMRGYEQCIPFNEETKHLLGTTDMPSEEYINW